jgi:protein SCO1
MQAVQRSKRALESPSSGAPEMTPASTSSGTAPSLFKTFAASTAALLMGLAVLLHATEQGSAFTTEALRRSQVDRAPQALPHLQLLDANGTPHDLHAWLKASNKVWVVNFIYTRCQTLCSALGATYQQMQVQLEARRLNSIGSDRVGLLSISFDPEHDNAAALRDYAMRMRANPQSWQVLTLAVPQDRQRLLDAFGIVVLPAPLGEFEHNAALHIVNAKAELVRIVDINTPAMALDAALAESKR